MAYTKYMKMSDPEYARIETKIRATYSKSCICWIEVVHNDELSKRFDKYYERIGGGTNENATKSICVYGFKAEYNKTSAFGLGTYFSTRAIYSKDYAQPAASMDEMSYMIIADWACGGGGGVLVRKFPIINLIVLRTIWRNQICTLWIMTMLVFRVMWLRFIRNRVNK